MTTGLQLYSGTNFRFKFGQIGKGRLFVIRSKVEPGLYAIRYGTPVRLSENVGQCLRIGDYCRILDIVDRKLKLIVVPTGVVHFVRVKRKINPLSGAFVTYFPVTLAFAMIGNDLT